MSELLLDISGVAKRYGAVAALRSASLAVRPGEVHALMGANGAGKSTLVKIMAGTVRADAGRITIRGQDRTIINPSDARKAGIVSVYQDPSIIRDLTVADHLRLTRTPVSPVLAWMDTLGIPDLDLGAFGRDLPLPTLRVLDLACALAVDPEILVLDEMTAALPADLTERVLDTVGRRRETGRSVVFISHRLIEIARLCDRATVLRDGQTVGVVDLEPGAQDRIVALMLGEAAEPGTGDAPGPMRGPERPGPGTHDQPRLTVQGLRAGRRLQDVSFELYPGEVMGVVALEGQGQEELFETLAGSHQPKGGHIAVDGRAVRFGHPADAIRAGLVYVPADRLQGLLPQRSVSENIALPFSAPVRSWGPIPRRRETSRVRAAIERLQIDTRAQSEVRRLSGGNQQKVTIARWIATGVSTLLCFDPTRGIDVRTKRQIYRLLRELADAGAAVLLYTSELEEVRLACDRVIVICGGRVVQEMPAASADEASLLRAAYALPPDAPIPEDETGSRTSLDLTPA